MSATYRSKGVIVTGGCFKGAVMQASLAAAFGCAMAAAQPAFAELKASDLAGRWVNTLADAKEACGEAACERAYDLVPCGNGWCGIEVKDDKTCGRTALRLNAGVAAKLGLTFWGSYEQAEGTQPYTIKATLYMAARPAAPGRLDLFVQGSTDGTFQPFRRTYPMQMLLTRAGDAACRGEPKLSALEP